MKRRSLLFLLTSLVAACTSAPSPKEKTAQTTVAAQLEAAERALPEWKSWTAIAASHDVDTCDEKGWCMPFNDAKAYTTADVVDPNNPLVAKGEGPLAAVLDFHAQLRSHGIALLVVLVPVRSTLDPASMAPPPASRARPDIGPLRFEAALEKAGIEVLDLYDAFTSAPVLRADDDGVVRDETIYRGDDLHWSSRGASLAAEAIAARLRGTEAFQEIVRKQGVTSAVLTDHWVTEKIDTKRFHVAPGRHHLHEVGAVGELVHATYDTASPIVLLGDSFAYWGSREGRHAGLPDHLLRTLGVKVDGHGMANGSPTSTRISLALQRPGLAGVKLVIYEMTTGALDPPDVWHKVDMFKKR